MKRIREIMVSPTPPPTDCIWLNKGELKYFNDGEWVYIGTLPNDYFDLYVEYKDAGGTKSKEEFVAELVDLIG